MLEEFKELLSEIANDSSEFANKQKEKLDKYMNQFKRGEITEKEFLSSILDLLDLQVIQAASIDIKTKAAFQRLVNKAKNLLAFLSK